MSRAAIALLVLLGLAGCGTMNDGLQRSSGAHASGIAEVCIKGEEASFDDVATLLYEAGYSSISACSERKGKVVAEVSYYDCDCSKDLFRVRITLQESDDRGRYSIDLSSTGPKKSGGSDEETAHRLLRRDARLYVAKIALANP